MGKYDQYKKQVLNTTVNLVKSGLLIATGGNVSLLVEGEDRVAVTPSGKDYLTLGIDDICVTDFDGHLVEGSLKPSIETSMHISVYKNRKDTGAVIHTHQIHGSIFSLINEPIPALFDEQVVNLGNRVEVVPYALSGTNDLLENITRAVANRCNGFILQNHGCIVLGMDLEKAAHNAMILEKTATIYFHALASGREVTRIPSDMEELIFTIIQSEQDKEAARKEQLRAET